MRVSIIAITTLIAGIKALTITSPSSGQTLDPTQPITVSWTSDSSDPATIEILAAASRGYVSETRVGRDVSTSSGTFIVPANAIGSYGTGWTIKVESSNGQLLATSPSFTLSMGFGAEVNGQSGLVEATTFTGNSAATRAASSGSATAAAGSTSGSNSLSSAVSSVSRSAASATGSASDSTTLTGSRTGFSTSTMSGTSRSTSATQGASSTSASSAATTSANAQPRLASGSQIVLSGAGLIAGLAALLA